MIRRDFLKSISLFGLTLSAPSVIAAEKQPLKASFLQQTTVKGKVLAGAKGLAGVVVTDGFTVMQTDASGNYNFVANAQSKFIHISIPSGYQIPHDNSIAQFYKPVSHTKQALNIDFSLKKSTKNDDKHGFVVWSDTQIQNSEDAALLMKNAAPDLKALVKTYPEGYLHGIGCGDLVWDKFELFPDYKNAIAQSGLPFFNVIGNHDMDIDARTDEGSSKTFESHFGPTYYSYNRGKIHYVVLDDVFFVGVAKNYIGYITEQQLKWLEKDLKFVKPGSTIVLSLHIPTFTNQSQRDKGPEGMGGTVTNRKRLYQVLADFKVHIMSGHTHFNEVIINENITEHVHGTVCGAWWTGNICGDGTPNGYGVYEADGDNISWFYKVTGKDRNYQMKIYPAGVQKDFPDEVAINVWGYDKNWQFECFADGQSIGAPIQKTAYDPEAYQNLLGETLPAGERSWVEPYLNDHMFFVKAPAAAKKIKVIAKDGFGNKYEAELAG